MATEAERFLRKARESLASAETDCDAGRCNSACNRAYYAAFQAAIAALINDGIRPRKAWEHRFVMSQFSGKLIARRKRLSASHAATLKALFDVRVTADYESSDVPGRTAVRSVSRSRSLITEIEEMMTRSTLREAAAEYSAAVRAGRKSEQQAADYIEELEATVLQHYPDADFGVIKFGPKDYRLNVTAGGDSLFDVCELLAPRTTEMLIDGDIWIVVVPHRRDEGDRQ